VKLLLQSGADVTVKRLTDGWSPLLIACHKGHESIAQLLIDAGADANMRSNGGYAPLHGACDEGNENAVKLLIESGADINVVDDEGQTPLHMACQEREEEDYRGRRQVIRHLILAGADTQLRDEEGCLAIDNAEGTRSLEEAVKEAMIEAEAQALKPVLK
jgi:ankyrin repeat protein